jgi:hypothetical protein
MATSWYKNYLAADVQPWARQVQKEVDNLKSNFQSAEVNNTTRDDQLASSLRQVQTAANNATQASADATQAAADAADAAQDALDAINGLTSLGSTGSSYSINADNITAGTIDAINIFGSTITGSTLTSGTSGARVEIAAQNMGFYNSNNTSAGIITGGGVGGAVVNGVNVISNGPLYLAGGTTTRIHSPTGNTEITGGGLILSNGGLSANGAVQGTAFSSTSLYSSGDIETDSSLRRNILIGGGTTGASITNGGNFVRTSSSQRYKTDIQLLDIDLNDLYTLQPKTFKRIDEVEEDGENARVYPGLIAEELAGTSLDKFVFYSKDEDGNPQPEGIHYPELTAALLLAVQDLNARITTLEG